MNRLTLLLFLICFLGSCSSDNSQKANEQRQRKISSFKSYDQNDSTKNAIFLQLPDSCKNKLKLIKVILTHGGGCKPMSNFILTIFADNDSYRLIINDLRFRDNKFDSMNDTVVEKDIRLNLYSFRSSTNDVLSYYELKNRINSTKRLAISATMNDLTLMKSLTSSSSLRHSNLIEIIYE